MLLLLSSDNPDVIAIVQQVRERARALLREVLQTAYAEVLAAQLARSVVALAEGIVE